MGNQSLKGSAASWERDVAGLAGGGGGDPGRGTAEGEGSMDRLEVAGLGARHQGWRLECAGRADWIRTSDLLDPIEARYQTALQPADKRNEIKHRGREWQAEVWVVVE
jgi:hypothetical protein